MRHNRVVEAYYYLRSMMWNDHIWELTMEAQDRLVTMLRETQVALSKEVMSQIKKYGHADEWTLRMEKDARQWLSQTLAAPAVETTEFIAATSVGIALSTMDEYNSILSFSGKAANIHLMKGLTQDQLMQAFTDQPLGGKALKEWVNETFDKRLQSVLIDAFQSGMEAGESYEHIVDRAMTAVDIGFIGTRRDISMLARTYVQSANTGAQDAVFKRNEDVIKGYTRRETMDNRTCPQCAFSDGLYYTKDEPRPALPIHPCCRGLYLPKTVSFRALGLDIDDLHEEARHWAIRDDGSIGEGGRQILSFGKIKGTYKEWWESLSEKDKAKTGVGPSRADLLRKGRLKWGDMIDKRTGRLVTLRELRDVA